MIEELQAFGNVLICGVNNEESYIIVCENWNGTIEDFDSIVNGNLVDYPIEVNKTLLNGILKVEYNK